MTNDTPEEFYKEIQAIQTSFLKDTANNVDTNYEKYYNDLAELRTKIQDQMDKIIQDKPVKSQQLLKDYTEIYNTQYMTNFCLVLGMGLILWYIVRSNTNVLSQNTQPNAPIFSTPGAVPSPASIQVPESP
jgi:hypothetical protein